MALQQTQVLRNFSKSYLSKPKLPAIMTKIPQHKIKNANILQLLSLLLTACDRKKMDPWSFSPFSQQTFGIL